MNLSGSSGGTRGEGPSFRLFHLEVSAPGRPHTGLVSRHAGAASMVSPGGGVTDEAARSLLNDYLSLWREI